MKYIQKNLSSPVSVLDTVGWIFQTQIIKGHDTGVISEIHRVISDMFWHILSVLSHDGVAEMFPEHDRKYRDN